MIAAYIIKRTPTSSVDRKIPEEVWTGKLAYYIPLQTFGLQPIPTKVRENLSLVS